MACGGLFKYCFVARGVFEDELYSYNYIPAFHEPSILLRFSLWLST